MPTLNINGHNMSVDAASDSPLLWAIREQLQMTGTKFGCGIGMCGACTVHVNGEAVRSCQTMVSDVADHGLAGPHGLAVDVDRAGAAHSDAAAELCAGHLQLLADGPE